VGRLGGSTSFGGGLSLAWVAIDFSWESRPVVDVSGSVRVGSGGFVVDVSRSVRGVVVVAVVVVVFVIVLEAGLSSSITIIVGSFRHRMLTLRIISSRRCCSAVGLGRYAKSFVFLYRVRNSSAVQLNGSPSRSVGVIARRSITTSCSV